MQSLPIGIQNFEAIRKEDFVYVDKTKHLLNLVKKTGNYFLSRPRRFGKSLTLSTLEAMFQGKGELFKELYAEEWVKEQSKHPNPVIKLDMGFSKSYCNSEQLNYYIISQIKNYLTINDLNMDLDENADITLSNLIIFLANL